MFVLLKGAGFLPTTKKNNQYFRYSGYWKKRRLALAVSLAMLGAGLNAYAEPVSINMPAQPLADALVQFAKKAGLTVAVDSALVKGKTAPALNGTWEPQEGLRRLLQGSGLHGVMEGDTAVIRKGAPEKKSIVTDAVSVRAKRFHEIGPLPGLGLTKDEIPGNVQSISAQEIKEAHSLSLTDLMNKKLQSVNVNDYQGNPFQMDVTYRGFTAGPQIGTPQGLSVFFDGIRVNEPFGDVVNWDMIPMNALASVDVFPGSNPIFGLGTLGGAFAVKTKDGFNFAGLNADVLTGSFGRKQLQVEAGWNNANKEEGSWDGGDFAFFAAGNFFLEDGWRQNSPSKVNQVFGKASYRGEKLDLNLSTLIVQTDLVGNGLLPSEMYQQDRNGVFTSPDTTKNTLSQFQLSGAFQVNDSFSVTGQVYRRNSRRHQIGGDVYTELENSRFRRALANGEQFTCLMDSHNAYGLPDYYVVDIPNDDLSQSAFFNEYFANGMDAAAALTSIGASLNPTLDGTSQGAAYLAAAQYDYGYWKNFVQSTVATAQAGPLSTVEEIGPVTSYSNGNSSFSALIYTQGNFTPSITNTAVGQTLDPILSMNQNFYYTADGTRHVVLLVNPTNAANCVTTQAQLSSDAGPLAVADPNNPGLFLMVDGAASADGKQPGVVGGTPTAVLTDTQIDQITEGGSVQLNWNLDKHKFMVGASVDAPGAKYKSGQRLAMMDAQRNVFLAPDQIRDQYAAADEEVSNNDFSGTQITKSIYASETWSPVDALKITGAVRYNDTHGKNKVASRTWGYSVYDLSQFESIPDFFNVCVNGDCSNVATGYKVPDLSRLLNAAETEKFSYYSLNPSLGATWQASENLNVYANWAKGVRTPSVIELGCAFDHTQVKIGTNPDTYIDKSLQENRSCSLPSTLSGDPYLPQIEARTVEAGLRGKWGDLLEWNLAAYRTGLRDDLYLISAGANRSYFDSIGKTRRQGVEAGISGMFGKAKFSLNYALTDATFQNDFLMLSNDNSSSVEIMSGNYNYGRVIQVKPGNRMPGASLHNLNATLSFDVTPKWSVALSAVAHSEAYVRGNENNAHRQGVVMYDTIETLNGMVKVARQPTGNPGTVPGYMVLNFQTSYQLAPEWRLGLQVNNLLDKEYFSAGRLGRNPFSPSIYGAIGPDGYNHNSSDWLSSNFLAPGAPRAAWVSLTYEFQPGK